MSTMNESRLSSEEPDDKPIDIAAAAVVAAVTEADAESDMPATNTEPSPSTPASSSPPPLASSALASNNNNNNNNKPSAAAAAATAPFVSALKEASVFLYHGSPMDIFVSNKTWLQERVTAIGESDAKVATVGETAAFKHMCNLARDAATRFEVRAQLLSTVPVAHVHYITEPMCKTNAAALCAAWHFMSYDGTNVRGGQSAAQALFAIDLPIQHVYVARQKGARFLDELLEHSRAAYASTTVQPSTGTTVVATAATAATTPWDCVPLPRKNANLTVGQMRGMLMGSTFISKRIPRWLYANVFVDVANPLFVQWTMSRSYKRELVGPLHIDRAHSPFEPCDQCAGRTFAGEVARPCDKIYAQVPWDAYVNHVLNVLESMTAMQQDSAGLFL